MDLLLLCNCDGVVDMTYQSISRRLKIPLRRVKSAIAKLCEPDLDSRSPEADGRRLVLLDENRSWGWQIVNHAFWRELKDDAHRTEYMREFMRRKRAAAKALKSNSDEKPAIVSGPLAPVSNVSSPLAHTDTDADTNTERTPPTPPRGNANVFKICTKHFSEFWERYPVKQGETKAKRFFFLSVKTENDVWAIHQALGHYLASDKVERGFILNGDKWLEDWKVWQNPTAEMMVDREKLAEYRAREKEEREAAEWAKRKDVEHGITSDGK